MSRSARFPYCRVLTPIGFVHVPIATVELSYRRARLKVEMTVDSGADLIMVPRYVGEALGMSSKGDVLRHLSGIAGDVPYLLKTAGLSLGPISFHARIAWAQRDDVPTLLGRAGFFDRFVITFSGPRGMLTVRE